MRRHDLEPVSLICGAVFLLVAVSHLAAAADGDVHLGWLLPVLLVGLGVAGLTGTLRSGRGAEPEAAADEPGSSDG